MHIKNGLTAEARRHRENNKYTIFISASPRPIAVML